jgi:hypothetical protein
MLSISLFVAMLNVAMPSAVVLSAIGLSVVAPWRQLSDFLEEKNAESSNFAEKRK